MEHKKLKSDVIGLVGAATLGVVMLSPAMTLYGGFGPAFLAAGKAAPIAFVWALIATLPTALSYAFLSSEYPVSGSAAAWTVKATTPRIGVWAGWIVFFYYFTNFVIQPVTLGVFFNDLLNHIHVASGLATFILGIVICCVWSGWMVYRGISLSAKGALAFLLFESAVVLALCLTVVVTRHHQLDWGGFRLTASPDGLSGVFRAMIFGVLAYCGFDVVSTLAEETKMARKLIPQATLLSLFLYAFIIIFGIWALTFGETADVLKKVAEQGQMPIAQIGASLWGKGSILITLTAISASLGLAVATSVGASRILFSMGRDKLVPAKLSEIHSEYLVPWNALHVIFGVGVLGACIVGLLMGPYNAYVWWSTTSTFFAMLTFILVNISCFILNRKKMTTWTGIGTYALIPLLGLSADIYILIRSFFIELWAQDWAVGKSVVVFDCACAGLALIAALRHRAQHR